MTRTVLVIAGPTASGKSGLAVAIGLGLLLLILIPFIRGLGLGGLLVPPVILVVIFGTLYGRYGDQPALRHILTGLAAAAVGLIAATVAKMAGPMFENRAVTAPLTALAAFVAIGIMQWSLPLVLVVLVPVSIALAWVRR